jgi:hypothetical protein
MTTFLWRPTEFDDNGEPTKHGWVEKPKRKASNAPMIGIFDAVTAPDGTRIGSMDQMRDYTNRTGMTNDLDSLRGQGQAELERSRNIKAPGTKKERVAVIRDAIAQASSSGYHRR